MYEDPLSRARAHTGSVTARTCDREPNSHTAGLFLFDGSRADIGPRDVRIHSSAHISRSPLPTMPPPSREVGRNGLSGTQPRPQSHKPTAVAAKSTGAAPRQTSPPTTRPKAAATTTVHSAANGSMANGSAPSTASSSSPVSSSSGTTPPVAQASKAAATAATNSGQSPQWIMRARYKQQMVPPRTWRQQEDRRIQLEAASQQRIARYNPSKGAAAAAAAVGRSKVNSQQLSAPSSKGSGQAPPVASPNRRFSDATPYPMTSRSSAPSSRRTSVSSVPGAQGLHSVSAGNAPAANSLEAARCVIRNSQRPTQTYTGAPSGDDKQQARDEAVATSSPSNDSRHDARRPSIPRRGSSQLSVSSQLSLSRVAATQATQSPRRRESSDSGVSSTSSVTAPPWTVSSREEGPGAKGDSTAPSPTSGTMRPRVGRAGSSTSVSMRGLPSPSSVTGSNGTTPSNGRNTSRKAQQFGGVPAADGSTRSVTATAAARASSATPIEVAPREPLPSKFVSTLTQALKREMNERQSTRQAEEQALDTQASELEKMVGNLASSASFRSVASAKSDGSAGSSHPGSIPLQAARSTSSAGKRLSQPPLNLDKEKEKEKEKANALSAALAAGGKAESEMARIHMQVNLAVQDALQTASRRELMKRYRPTSHWSAPARPTRRPQLKRLTTTDSNMSSQTNDSSIPGGGSQPLKSWRLLPEAEDSGDSEPSTPMTPSSSVQSFGSVPMHGAADFTSSTSSLPSLVHSQQSQPQASPVQSSSSPVKSDVPRWKSWTQSVLSRQRGGPKRASTSKNVGGASPASTSPTALPVPSPGAVKPAGVTPATYMAPGLSVQPPTTAPRQEPMLHTLRGRSMRNKRFNEDKPWKNHQDLNFLSEAERKRYEKLWAANRCSHLPFLFINPEFEGLWHAAVSRRFPHLYKKDGDQSSTKTSDSNGSSHLSASPSRPLSHHWELDHSDHASHRSKKRSKTAGVIPGSDSVDATESAGGSYREGSSGARSQRGNLDFVSVERYEDMINAANSGNDKTDSYTPDREISPVSVIDMDEKDAEEVQTEQQKQLDSLQNIAGGIESDVEKQSDDVHGYVVSRLWRRSKLPDETLAEIWDLVDMNRDGTLDRSSFVVGMWLCDQCLYGRKLPARVPYEVWQSVGKLHLKVRFKQRKSKVWYMSQLPNFMGSAVGHTMHGGRQAVKKVVQTATS